MSLKVQGLVIALYLLHRFGKALTFFRSPVVLETPYLEIR